MAGVRRSGDIGTRDRAIACGSSTGARAHMVTHRTVHERTAKIARRDVSSLQQWPHSHKPERAGETRMHWLRSPLGST